MSDLPNREVAVFEAAIRLPIGERSAYLDQVCADEPDLRRAVEALLYFHDQAGDFLEQSPMDGTNSGSQMREKPGDVIGRYKLLKELGEGGCGVVYLAEQEEPVRREVALKIIKPGMDTKSVIARFEAERQVLALMDHPNIAKVFDAGATSSGRAYFVMELVRGVKITEYCDQNSLTTEERLQLFVQVCHAVQHAHQKGIIHRDIKPSNILVTKTLEGAALPVLIDFGIAKATTNQRLTDKTVFTALEMLIGTPAYMSPEQAALTAIDVDTRSDIYSLGVLLYELLTGSTPFDARDLLQAGLDEIRRVIREQDPVRPSTRLSKMLGPDLTDVAQHRKSEPPRLIRVVSGDLDWIAMKALEKDRTRRYDTANGLAMDLQRYLDNEPVLARPPSTFYRAQKLVLRHKLAVGAGAAIAMMLVLGIAASLWQAARANREASRAVAAEQKATDRAIDESKAREQTEAVLNYLIKVFQSPDPAQDGLKITVAESLDRAARRLESELVNQPHRRARLQETLAFTYNALGLPRKAIPLREKARDYFLKNSGPEHPDTLAEMGYLAISYADAGRKDEALQIQEHMLTLRRKLNRPDDKVTLVAMSDLATSYFDAGRRDEALKLREEVLTLAQNAKSGLNDFDMLPTMNNVALSYFHMGRIDESLKLQEKVLELTRKINGPKNPDTLTTMNNLAISYAAAKRTDEALKLEEEGLALRREVNGPEANGTLIAMNNLANLYNDCGRKEESLKLFEELLAIQRKTLDPEHPDPMCRAVMYHVATLAGAAGRGDEALKQFEELLTLERKAFDPKHPGPVFLSTIYSLAASYLATGRKDEATKLYEEAVAVLRQTVDANPTDTDTAKQLATIYLWLGRTNEHQAICRKLLALATKSKDPSVHDRAAKAYLIQAHPDPELLKLAVASGRQVLQLATANHPDRNWFLVTAAMAGVRDGRPAEAESLLDEVINAPGDDRVRRCLALAYRSLARTQLGRTNQARADLAELEKLIHNFPVPLSTSAIPFPPDVLAVFLAHEEAKALQNPPLTKP